jgi:pyruvate-formate lyase
MRHYKVKHSRPDLGFEIAFTAAHRQATREPRHPAELELAMMRVQYPAILMPIEDDDLIAGRIQYGLAGWGVQDQTGGSGYYCVEPEVAQAIVTGEGSRKYREDLSDLLVYWKARSTYNRCQRSLPPDVAALAPDTLWMTSPRPIAGIIRNAAAYVDFDRLVRGGLPGLEAEIRGHLARCPDTGNDPVFYESALGALDVVRDCCWFYERQARELSEATTDPRRAGELRDMADALAAITARPPEHMLEGLQLAWLYGQVALLVEWGRMDEYIGDLYAADIDSGHITEDQALAYTVSYFRLVDHLDAETDGRVIVGGYGRRNPANADRFCLTAIEACRTFKEVLPQFTLRFNRDTPAAVWDAAMHCIGEGRSYPLLYNDDVLVPGIGASFGVPRELAERYVPLGCGEIELDHYSFGSPNGLLNTLLVLELAIRGGANPLADRPLSLVTKPLVECGSFEEFLGEYHKHLEYLIEAIARYAAHIYEFIGAENPYLLISALYDGCLDRGKGFLGGGVAYLHGSLELYGNVNAANSLAAIKKLVFDEGVLTAGELVAALDDNFVGHSRLRRLLLDAPKYGNDDPFVDQIMVDLHDWLSATIAAQAAPNGLDNYLGVTINNSMNTDLGRLVGATPDGRKAGTPMANANNPSPGTDTHGITAMLNSLVKLRNDNHDGMVQNLRFVRETWNAAGGVKTQALLRSYFDRGGGQAMITVVGRDDLKSAMERPEEWRDLIVRVGGYSARFVELTADVQQEIYDRVAY